MAVRPGEELVATLFGDVHYFYGSPTDVPPHHRFDKGSYVYLFEDAGQARARIEVANRPGTEHQDSFDGFLDSTHIRYSYKQSCVVTLTVGRIQGHEEWHLPTYDPQNQNIYHYKLHSVDIYFWTPKDALTFINGARVFMPPQLLEILDEPAPPPRQPPPPAMSSTVQKLENLAISGEARPSAGSSAPSFAPLPTSDDSDRRASPPAAAAPKFVPMAYNPAAPAAPEQIRHREKTPPPEDDGLSPLQARLAQDAGTPFSPGLVSGMPQNLGPLSPGMPPPQFHNTAGSPSFPGPPLASPSMPPQGFGSLGAGVHPGINRAATVPVTGMHSAGLAAPYPYPGSPGFGAAAQHSQQAQQQQQQQSYQHPGMTATPPPPPPPGGYSQYQYGQPGAGPSAGDYGIHQQAYRPTEGEANIKYKPKQEVRGRFEENAGRIEKGMTGMLKKFEKKFG